MYPAKLSLIIEDEIKIPPAIKRIKEVTSPRSLQRELPKHHVSNKEVNPEKKGGCQRQ